MDKIKVLFLAANPLRTTRLRLDEQVREIEAKIRAAEYPDSLENRLPRAQMVKAG